MRKGGKGKKRGRGTFHRGISFYCREGGWTSFLSKGGKKGRSQAKGKKKKEGTFFAFLAKGKKKEVTLRFLKRGGGRDEKKEKERKKEGECYFLKRGKEWEEGRFLTLSSERHERGRKGGKTRPGALPEKKEGEGRGSSFCL